MSNKRALTVGFLTAGLSVGVIASVISPAAAQGNPVGGEGNAYFLSGAVNASGQAQKINVFGDAGDEVFYGDWYGTGEDLPLVRRGNVFFVPDAINNSVTKSIFAYGDAGDTVLIGDWDGNGADSIAIQRGNHFFVKNQMQKSGVADSEFYYGDKGDTVLVGNWNGVTTTTVSPGHDYNNDHDYTDPATPAYGADVANTMPVYSTASGVDNTLPADNDYTDTTVQPLAYQPTADVAPDLGDDGVTGGTGANADTPGVDNTVPADNDYTDTTIQPLAYQPVADVAPGPRVLVSGDPGFDANKNGDYNDAGDRQPGTGVDNNKDGDFTDAAQAAVPAEDAPGTSGKGDTIMIQRGNQFFVKNSIETGVADYTFYFGDAGDDILVGDWATPAKAETSTATAVPATSGDGADQLAVRRGFKYFLSSELEAAHAKKANPTTAREFAYGDAGDTVFVASLASEAVDEFGRPVTTTAPYYAAGDTMYSSTGTSLGTAKTDRDLSTPKRVAGGGLATPGAAHPVIVVGDGLGVRRVLK